MCDLQPASWISYTQTAGGAVRSMVSFLNLSIKINPKLEQVIMDLKGKCALLKQ